MTLASITVLGYYQSPSGISSATEFGSHNASAYWTASGGVIVDLEPCKLNQAGI